MHINNFSLLLKSFISFYLIGKILLSCQFFSPEQICSGLARYTIIKQVNNFYLISMLLKKMAVIYIFTLI